MSEKDNGFDFVGAVRTLEENFEKVKKDYEKYQKEEERNRNLEKLKNNGS